jgi:hypothetical protein
MRVRTLATFDSTAASAASYSHPTQHYSFISSLNISYSMEPVMIFVEEISKQYSAVKVTYGDASIRLIPA